MGNKCPVLVFFIGQPRSPSFSPMRARVYVCEKEREETLTDYGDSRGEREERKEEGGGGG